MLKLFQDSSNLGPGIVVWWFVKKGNSWLYCGDWVGILFLFVLALAGCHGWLSYFRSLLYFCFIFPFANGAILPGPVFVVVLGDGVYICG